MLRNSFPADVVNAMREDWNRRAKEDAYYYVAFAQRNQEDAAGRGAGIQRLRYRYQCDTLPLEALQQFAQVLDTASEPVELRNDDGFHFSGVHQRGQPGHAGPVQALGGLAALDDDLTQFHALHQRHRPDLLCLRASREIPRSACWSVETRT